MRKTAIAGLLALAFSLALNVKAAQPVNKPTPKQQPSKVETGNLKIKVGVVMGSGVVNFVPQTDFYLLKNSFSEARKTAQAGGHITQQEFLTQKNASPELLSYADKHPVDIDYGFFSCYSVNGLEYIPELSNIAFVCKKNNFNLGENEFQSLLPVFLRHGIGGEGENYSQYTGKLLSQGFTQAETEAKTNKVQSCTTNFSGECEFKNIPIGSYYITNINPTRIGNSSIWWDLKMDIMPGENNIELSNRNADSIF